MGENVYQLVRPGIDEIVNYCKDLLSDEKLEVYEFGENCDLVLHIYKDEDYNPDKDRDYCNIVTISTARDGNLWMTQMMCMLVMAALIGS